MYSSARTDTVYSVDNYPLTNRNRKSRPQNSGSSLLSDYENSSLFASLGNDCISLTAAVCQLYRGDNGKWTRIVTGVVSLVKDYNRRSYVMRMYDMESKIMSWEQTL